MARDRGNMKGVFFLYVEGGWQGVFFLCSKGMKGFFFFYKFIGVKVGLIN